MEVNDMKNIRYLYTKMLFDIEAHAVYNDQCQKRMNSIRYYTLWLMLGGFSYKKAHRLVQEYIDETYQRRKNNLES